MNIRVPVVAYTDGDPLGVGVIEVDSNGNVSGKISAHIVRSLDFENTLISFSIDPKKVDPEDLPEMIREGLDEAVKEADEALLAEVVKDLSRSTDFRGLLGLDDELK